MAQLNHFEPSQFLTEYWQRQPLLARSVLANTPAPVSARALMALAGRPEVESRVVARNPGTGAWQLEHGPFEPEALARLGQRNWTLLVQAVDLWLPPVAQLLNAFDFLPRWRLDDIMVSYATPGGGVGPHSDQYDVFLLQVEGTRRWRIAEGAAADLDFSADPDAFVTEAEWLLAPGDMLYLPPGVPHWGTAESACITCSIGFRAPSLADMLGDIAIELMAQDNDSRYTDPPLTPAMATNRMDPAFIKQAQHMLRELADDEALLGDWLCRYMTAPKYPELVDQTAESRLASYQPAHADEDGERFYRNGDLID